MTRNLDRPRAAAGDREAGLRFSAAWGRSWRGYSSNSFENDALTTSAPLYRGGVKNRYA